LERSRYIAIWPHVIGGHIRAMAVVPDGCVVVGTEEGFLLFEPTAFSDQAGV
jgi:hypothetical protein